MQYITAFILAQLGGCENPSAADIKKIVSAAGAEYDEQLAESTVSALSGKNIDSLIAQGKSQLCSVASQGPSASAAPAAATSSAAPAKQAEKPAPKKEESDEEMGMSLFD
jgi:large subunit ribosomal protein LP2